MAITIPMILERLSTRVLEKDHIFSQRKTDVLDVVLLESPLTDYKENRLYILQPHLPVADLNGILPMNLLYIQNDDVFYTGRFLENQAIIVLKRAMNVQDLISEIQDIILYYKEMFDQLLSLAGTGAGLQNMVNTIADYLMNPVSIFARGLKLLAHSQNYIMDYKPWFDTEEKGYLVTDTQRSNLLKELAKMNEKNTSPFIYFAEGMNYKIGTTLIILGDQQIGVFHVVEYNQPITQSALDIMEAVRVFLAIELNKKHLIGLNSGILNEQLIVDLLEKRVDSLQLLRSRSHNIGWVFAQYVFVLVIKPVSHFLVGEQLSKIRKRLTEFRSFNNCLVYDRSIVVIINKNNDTPYEEHTQVQLLALLKEFNLCCGLSQCSATMLDTAKLYKQSLQAIKLGLLVQPGFYIYNYMDYALYDFFDNCLQNDNISSYYHSSINALKAYDEKHNGMLLDTLHNYIYNQCNQNETAKQMYIHRSTLIYRLNKIEQITNIDFNNINTIFHLELSFKLLEFDKQFNAAAKETSH
jgi:Regulator of polyketide synthase expression